VERCLIDLSNYVGRQWSPDCTCWSGIVTPVYREFLGVDLPTYDTVPPTVAREVIPAARRVFAAWQIVPDGRERPMDVVLFDHGTHCGLVVGRNNMLHLEQGKTSVVTSYRSALWAARIVSFHRLAF
jgi:cell wall-associated NlpC family hydrolase